MFKIISDSACDLSNEYVEQHDVDIVPFYVSFNEKDYYKDGIEMKRDEFYNRIVNEGGFPKTSLPSVEDYIDHFTPYVKQGIPIICITISTVLSGSYNSASTAKDIIIEDYPDAKITVVNSLANTASQALFVNEVVRMNEDGIDYDIAVSKLDGLCNSATIFFTVGSLDYLKKGGRIGKLATMATGKLGIKPIIIMKGGELNIGGVGRNRSKLLKSIISQVNGFLNSDGNTPDDFEYNMGEGYDSEEANAFLSEAEATIGKKTNPELNVLIGPTSACHTGPHALGLAVIKKYEKL
ncbi:MAG: DegV family protein [Lachnospiraceae bacterium]|nr:DegV family protein [Lachnospiraceae bacterium]